MWCGVARYLRGEGWRLWLLTGDWMDASLLALCRLCQPGTIPALWCGGPCGLVVSTIWTDGPWIDSCRYAPGLEWWLPECAGTSPITWLVNVSGAEFSRWIAMPSTWTGVLGLVVDRLASRWDNLRRLMEPSASLLY